MIDQIEQIQERLTSLETHFYDSGYAIQKLVTSQVKEKSGTITQPEAIHSLHLAMCVETLDPLKQGRVRFYSPLMVTEKYPPVKSLPFAFPISVLGGFDDSGATWVPPAGSTLALVFESGSKSAPFYLGTIWHRDRGPDGEHRFAYPSPEYYEIHEGHRRGYLVGPDDGSQVLPPWNTESYNGIDVTSQKDYVPTPDAEKRTTYPNIYGFKTPQKHMVKKVDGDYKCNHKHKRLEIMSSCGNWMIFKDDHLHEIEIESGEAPCPDPTDPSNVCKNVSLNVNYFKHKHDLRPFVGPQTPQNNKYILPQSGIQFLSISGHTIYMDDSVEQPTGIPNWERSTLPFDFGCTDKFLGKMAFVSATGHRIEMNDEEAESGIRSENNKIMLRSAAGNRIELNDHSIGPEAAGAKRGIWLQSTSNHVLEMCDDGNEQGSPFRREVGAPVPKAKRAYVKMRTGYGLEILMADNNSQSETQQQEIKILAPQKTNDTRGPHILRFLEAADGPGQVMLEVGGNYFIYTYDNMITEVGSDENPSNYERIVSKDTALVTKQMYFNKAAEHEFIADRIISLLAGKDCPIPDTDDKGPCPCRVIVLKGNKLCISDRIIGSASPDAPLVTIDMLGPAVRNTSSENTV